MINRIEISSAVQDAGARVLLAKLHKLDFSSKVDAIALAQIYTVDRKLSSAQLDLVTSMLTNPVTQRADINSQREINNFNWAAEIGFLPGVTDNVAKTTKEAIEDLLDIRFGESDDVYSSNMIYITGKLTRLEVEEMASNLANPLIMRILIKNYKEFKRNNGMDKIVPRVKLNVAPKVIEVDLDVNDEELTAIGKQGILGIEGRRGPLALDLIYMQEIRDYFKKLRRKPTDVELESIAQTWSEHCKHTIFADPIDEVKNGLYKEFIQKATREIRLLKGKADFCVSVFTDNSGAIKFDENYLITDKVETHNSPSALDPFGGAITGIVGVNRDAIGFGQGARPIVNRYGFCLADPSDTVPLYKGKNKTQKMLSSKFIMEGVIEGVNVGGNCSGIPTPLGFLQFDNRYKGKPLVFVGTVGLIPTTIKGKAAYKKRAKSGDYIVVIGGRVGKDGIHGATFSSEALDMGSPATAVQIGDPITQKKLSDAVVKEANMQKLFNSITDNGAGGISCSVAEMAKECGGCEVNLDKVPLKYPNLSPWEIWISESQERMTLAVAPIKWLRFKKLMESRGVEVANIGKFSSSGKCIVWYKGQKVMDLRMDFLHDGLPIRPMQTSFTKVRYEEPKIVHNKNLNREMLQLLGRLNVAGFEFISTQYDHEVQASSVLKPLQGKGRVNGDAVVVKPVFNSDKGVVLSHGLCPSYSDIDTYHMAACSIDTAVRNAVAIGANIDYLALLDNFCWCSSNESVRLGQLKRAAEACYDTAVSYGTPFISGKDSMFNDFKGYDDKGNSTIISIPPTLLISSIGVIEDIAKVVSLDFKFPGDYVYLLGETNNELGGSEYYSMFDAVGNSVPRVDALRNKRLYRAYYRAIQSNLISSGISLGKAGLGVALAKSAIAGQLGIEVRISDLLNYGIDRIDTALFSESQGRLLVSVCSDNVAEFEKEMLGQSMTKLGVVIKNSDFVIQDVVNLDLDKMTKAYRSSFKGY